MQAGLFDGSDRISKLGHNDIFRFVYGEEKGRRDDQNGHDN
jgi:hypothetical protein